MKLLKKHKLKIRIPISGIWRAWEKIKNWTRDNDNAVSTPPYNPTEEQQEEIERLTKRLERRKKENNILKKSDTARSIRG